jgi:hypothetical protein
MTHAALNTTAAQEHIGEIVEQKIRVIKESARGMFNTLLYKKLMVIELLHNVDELVSCEVWYL